MKALFFVSIFIFQASGNRVNICKLDKHLCYENQVVNNNSDSRPVIYGLEFLGSSAGALVSHFSLYSLNNKEQWTNGPEPWIYGTGYALTTTALTTAGTHLIGKLFKQGGNWKKAAIGAGIASSFVSFIEYNFHRFGVEYC